MEKARYFFTSMISRPELQLSAGFRCEVGAAGLGRMHGQPFVNCKIRNHGSSAVQLERVFCRISGHDNLIEVEPASLSGGPVLLEGHHSYSVEFDALHLFERVPRYLRGNVLIRFFAEFSDKRIVASGHFTKHDLNNYLALVQSQFKNTRA